MFASTKNYSKIMLLLLIITFFMVSITGCGEEAAPDDDVTVAPDELADRIYMLNWSDYIHPDAVAEFEEKYGVEVVIDFFADSEELLAKIQSSPGLYDLIVPSDYIVEVMIELDLLEEINFDNVPNIENVIPYFRTSQIDPEGKYAVIYTFGTTGLAYNSDYVSTPESWEILWDPQYQGRISIMDSAREGIAPILQYLGYSINTRDPEELMEARDLTIDLKPNLLDFIIVGMEEMLAAEEVWLMQTWSGRALRAQEENPAIEYTIPKEGGMVWMDYLTIPKDAPNKATAEFFINFLLDGEINLKNAYYVQYGTGNQAALDLADPEYRDNEIINPPTEFLERMEQLTDVGEATELYDQFWTEILVAR